MKKLFAIAAAAMTLALAAPASAAVTQNINVRQASIEQRIDMGLRTGRLTRHEAMDLRNDLRGIERLEMRYRRGGLNRAERADLDRRLDRLAFELTRELNDRQRAPTRTAHNDMHRAPHR
jgi:hypothetical protein